MKNKNVFSRFSFRLFILGLALAFFSGAVTAQESCSKTAGADSCSVSGVANGASGPAASQPKGRSELSLFYAYDCPHCHEAIKWLTANAASYPQVTVAFYEIKRDTHNRELFSARLAERRDMPASVPVIFFGDAAISGFGEPQKAQLAALLDAASGKKTQAASAKTISVPVLGEIDPAGISLLKFTLVIGLLDGLNPCAMWVLMFLLGLLVYTRSAGKMLLVGGIFVAASGLVYFAFMAAWFNLFLVIGYSRWITLGLGCVAVVMGLINIKELFFFKQGVSLMIADSAKPKLAAKMRGIVNESRLFVMITATVLLAVFVNLIELGCTIGLPAIFTRVLSLRHTGLWEKYGYLALYNVAYVVPLAAIVALFVCTLGRYRMTERHGKILKLVSGLLMLVLGLLLIFKADILVGS